jgi:hypothetical protein
MKLCRSWNCEREATRMVFWPGQTTELCDNCASRAQSTAEAMGFVLEVRPLAAPIVVVVVEGGES